MRQGVLSQSYKGLYCIIHKQQYYSVMLSPLEDGLD